MSKICGIPGIAPAATGFALALLTSASSAWAAPTRIVYGFIDSAQHPGHFPGAGVIIDKAGNLYGTAGGGIMYNAGVVYKVTPAGGETALHNFRGSPDGSFPGGELIMDARGIIYGTTRFGGTANAGTVFRLAGGVLTGLYSFPGGSNGNPEGRLALDTTGNLYGTTSGSGNNYGVVFKLAPGGKETVLHTFINGKDGGSPASSSLVRGAGGDLYGTTASGGANGHGTVFRITPTGTETVLHSFAGPDGDTPEAGVILDKNGNLYGTTYSGGPLGRGTVFKLTLAGTETVLYSFPGGVRGAGPSYGLVMGATGNLYGTAGVGDPKCQCGIVFAVTQAGQEFVLHTFTDTPDGYSPVGDLAIDAAGNLYGVTLYGGAKGGGAVFEVTK